MKYEKSCGAVVYTEEDGVRKYLIELSKRNHRYGMPKGHVEAKENELETAKREIFEETGLTPDIDTAFRYVITYSPKEGVMKDVVYFTAWSGTTDTVPQPEEVEEIVWLTAEEALPLLYYPQNAEVLTAADAWLEEHRN